MAAPAVTTEAARAAHVLAVAEREIAEAIDVIARWRDMTDDERADLRSFWPATVDFYRRSRAYAKDGVLTTDQRARLTALRERYRAHQPAFAAVMGGEWADIDRD